MNDLEYLKSFTINEIANKTHLDKFTVKAIIEKDYEKLLNVNIKMNIKILEREYNVNFEEWLKEFNAYKENNFKENDESFRVKPKVMGYNSNNEGDGGFGIFGFIIIVLIIVGAGAYYYYNQNDDASEITNVIKTEVNDDKKVEILTNVLNDEKPNEVVKEEIKEQVKNEEQINKKDEKEVNEKDKTTNDETKNALTEEIKENKEEVKENVEKEEQKEVVKAEEKAEVKENTKTEIKQEHKLFLNPKQKSWVSVKDLETKKTRNYLLERGVSFTNDSLIFVGHTRFTLELDGESLSLPVDKDARYILFKDGKVDFIGQQEYVRLDKEK